LCVLGQNDSQQIYVFLLTAFGWASASEPIAMVIVEHADALSGYHGGEFQGKIRDFALKLARSPNPAVRVKLCEFYALNPATFLSGQSLYGRVFKSLSEDSEIEVRLSFIRSFPILYSRSSSVQLTDALFTLLLPSFSDGDPRIHDALLSDPTLFQLLTPSKLNAAFPGFLRILDSLVRWRSIRNAIDIFVRFPPESFFAGYRQIAPLVRSKLEQSPFALADAARVFYIASIEQDDDALALLLSLARAPAHQLRSFFLKFVACAGQIFAQPVFLERVWPIALGLSQDAAVPVLLTFVRCCRAFRALLAAHGQAAAAKHLTTVFMVMGTMQDHAIEAVWRVEAERIAEGQAALSARIPQLRRSALIAESPPHEFKARGPPSLRVVPTTDPTRKRKLDGRGGRMRLSWPPLFVRNKSGWKSVMWRKGDVH
jgi:hypothetical protein